MAAAMATTTDSAVISGAIDRHNQALGQWVDSSLMGELPDTLLE